MDEMRVVVTININVQIVSRLKSFSVQITFCSSFSYTTAVVSAHTYSFSSSNDDAL